MASSNRHWPSLFKSKPCTTHHQWQHDINPSCLVSTGCQKTPYSSVPGCEERSPEPKPRWNPKPEQIRILEAIFNSGMVNPPRDEIRKIRAQLQEYGQVGDANVFYWFQNRKSRSKHKLRHLQAARTHTRSATAAAAAASSSPAVTAPTATAATSSSSSSSDQSSASDKVPPPSILTVNLTSITDTSAVPATSMSQMYFHSPVEFGGEPFFFHCPQGQCLSAADLTATGIIGVAEHGTAVSSGLWGEFMGQEWSKGGEDEAMTTMQLHHGYGVGATTAAAAGVAPPIATITGGGGGGGGGGGATVCTGPAPSVAGPVNEVQGVGGGVAGEGGDGGGAARMMVFINEVPFEVAAGPLNVWDAFGAAAVLLHTSGHPVLTDEWGVTLHPLQHGASYYLI